MILDIYIRLVSWTNDLTIIYMQPKLTERLGNWVLPEGRKHQVNLERKSHFDESILSLKCSNTTNPCCSVYTSVSWKVRRLTKILSWNVIKWGLFFITLFQSVLQCFDHIDKSHLQNIWCHHVKCSTYEIFSVPSYTQLNTPVWYSLALRIGNV